MKKLKDMELSSTLLDSVKVLDLSLHLCNLIGSRDIKIFPILGDFFFSRTLICIAPDANDKINIF